MVYGFLGIRYNERMRKIITGYPRTGKTTLATETEAGTPVRHTDNINHLGWSEQSTEVARWFNFRAPWVVEGVTCVRALRKWLRENEGAPCDEIVYLTSPHVELSPSQETMAKGIETVWGEIKQDLIGRGVTIL